MTSGSFTLNRIRILKTGLANIQEKVDFSTEENRIWFEKLASPGTELKLMRVKNDENDFFRVEVYSPDNRFLGAVTRGKNETVARMMDAGLKVKAIVNRSLPVHDSDVATGFSETDDPGWEEESREIINYSDCNLPYGIYYEEN